LPAKHVFGIIKENAGTCRRKYLPYGNRRKADSRSRKNNRNLERTGSI
jgi:hypothetical protein